MAVELAGKYEVHAWQGHEPRHLSPVGIEVLGQRWVFYPREEVSRRISIIMSFMNGPSLYPAVDKILGLAIPVIGGRTPNTRYEVPCGRVTMTRAEYFLAQTWRVSAASGRHSITIRELRFSIARDVKLTNVANILPLKSTRLSLKAARVAILNSLVMIINQGRRIIPMPIVHLCQSLGDSII